MKKRTFEDSLKRLEKIIDEMENSQLDIDKAMKLFEEGIKLSNTCYETLQKAEQKITLITALKNTEEEEK